MRTDTAAKACNLQCFARSRAAKSQDINPNPLAFPSQNLSQKGKQAGRIISRRYRGWQGKSDKVTRLRIDRPEVDS